MKFIQIENDRSERRVKTSAFGSLSVRYATPPIGFRFSHRVNITPDYPMTCQ